MGTGTLMRTPTRMITITTTRTAVDKTIGPQYVIRLTLELARKG